MPSGGPVPDSAQASKDPETGMTPRVQILLVIYCLGDLQPICVLVSSSVEWGQQWSLPNWVVAGFSKIDEAFRTALPV